MAKKDNLDSKLLHDYANTFSLRREQLLVLKNQETVRLDNAYSVLCKESLSSPLKYLDEQLEAIDAAIKEICSNNPKIKGKINQLISIPGVGITLATKVICEVPERGEIEFQKLTSLVGLVPYSRDSDQYKGKRSIFSI